MRKIFFTITAFCHIILMASLACSSLILISCKNEDTIQQKQEVYQNPTQVRITSPSGLVIRSGPSRSDSKISTIAFNEKADIVDAKNGPSEKIEDKEGKWLKIRYNQLEGWVFSGYTEFVTTSSTGNNSSGTIDFILKGACVPLDKRYTYKEIKSILPEGYKEVPSNSQLLIMNKEFTIVMDKLNFDYVLSSIEFKGKTKLLLGIERGMRKEELLSLLGNPSRSDKNVDHFIYTDKAISIETSFVYSGTKLDRIIWKIL